DRRRGHALLCGAVAGRAGHGGDDRGGRRQGPDGRAGSGGVPTGDAGFAGLSPARPCGAGTAGLAPATACVDRPARLRDARIGGAAGDHVVAAGARAATSQHPWLVARPAPAGGIGDAAVPHHQGRLRIAVGDPVDRRAVRRRSVCPASGPQDRTQRAVMVDLRGIAGGPLALWLAWHGRGALDAGRDGVAGAVVLRQQVRAGAGPDASPVIAGPLSQNEAWRSITEPRLLHATASGLPSHTAQRTARPRSRYRPRALAGRGRTWLAKPPFGVQSGAG